MTPAVGASNFLMSLARQPERSLAVQPPGLAMSCPCCMGQANSWEHLSPGGTLPSDRFGHVAVWSDLANGLYIFAGGAYGSRGPGL